MITPRQAKHLKHLTHEMAQSFALVAATHANGRSYGVLKRRITRKKATAIKLEAYLASITEELSCLDPTDSNPKR